MAGNEFDSFDLDSFDFGDFDSLDTGVNVQNQPVATPDVSNIVTSLKKRAMVVFSSWIFQVACEALVLEQLMMQFVMCCRN